MKTVMKLLYSKIFFFHKNLLDVSFQNFPEIEFFRKTVILTVWIVWLIWNLSTYIKHTLMIISEILMILPSFLAVLDSFSRVKNFLDHPLLLFNFLWCDLMRICAFRCYAFWKHWCTFSINARDKEKLSIRNRIFDCLHIWSSAFT